MLSTRARSLTPNDTLAPQDQVRIREFYRLAATIQDQVWPGWSQVPAPLLLIAREHEYLLHFPNPPKDFAKAGDEVFVRARHFPPSLQATFPAFGPPSVIVVGIPETTASGSSTPWLIMLMHEHFHQLQDSQPGLFQKIDELGLSHGDSSGMWMLNYPFPYEMPVVADNFAKLRDLLLTALNEQDETEFQRLAAQYVQQRKAFVTQISEDHRKYVGLQLWKEGIARYIEVRCAEAAERYQPTAEFAALADFKGFDVNGQGARRATLDELRRIKFAEWKRTSFYAFGAAEGFFLDRYKPAWKKAYFEHPLSMDAFFQE